MSFKTEEKLKYDNSYALKTLKETANNLLLAL